MAHAFELVDLGAYRRAKEKIAVRHALRGLGTNFASLRPDQYFVPLPSCGFYHPGQILLKIDEEKALLLNRYDLKPTGSVIKPNGCFPVELISVNR